MMAKGGDMGTASMATALYAQCTYISDLHLQYCTVFLVADSLLVVRIKLVTCLEPVDIA